jgi:glycosidase
MRQQARKSPEFINNSVVYQVFLRTFTPEGTIESGTKMLPHLADMGVDIVYLCPVFLQDDDENTALWSTRQNASGIGNPQNPYRIKDYFSIDPEYGTDADLKEFIRNAQSLGMKVLLDLVYLHCGPNAVFIKEHPEFVQRDADGKVINGRWNFPLLNFESRKLREYLWSNMEYFMKEFDVDGYRCDVAPAIPLDFWEEARERMEKINSEFIMISEGDKEKDQLKAFDLGYAMAWEYALMKTFRGEINVKELRETWQKMHDEYPEGSRFLRILDNHDVAMDCGLNRHEIAFGNAGVDAALLVNFALDGMPFIYNGQEIADCAPHSIYSNRFYGKMAVNWANAMTETGKARLAFMKQLIKLKHSQEALDKGTTRWLENSCPEQLISFTRECDGQRLLLLVNATKEMLSAEVEVNVECGYTRELLKRNTDYSFGENGKVEVKMLPHAFLLIQY